MGVGDNLGVGTVSRPYTHTLGQRCSRLYLKEGSAVAFGALCGYVFQRGFDGLALFRSYNDADRHPRADILHLGLIHVSLEDNLVHT